MVLFKWKTFTKKILLKIFDNFLVVKKNRKKVVGPERGPLSLVSTTEELLGRKVAAPV
jgi:hypothetical protein